MEFAKETQLIDTAFPVYRRRSPVDGGREATINRGKYKDDLVDNRWVVPFNPYLLLKLDCHVNVVIVTSVISVKYVYKYQYKGPDRILMTVEKQNERNEVTQFVSARYISASESVWKLLNFPIQGKSHAVVKLACHLPLNQSVFFKAGEEEDALERGKEDTMLTAWFAANQVSEEARTVLYSNFPEEFVYQNKAWKPRKAGHGKTIGRVPAVPLNPHTMEQYSLRLILHHVPGAQSFEDLRTVSDVLHPTFQSAAVALGLLEDDAELDKAMTEAFEMKFGDQLREFFLSILLYCRPADPPKFWRDHKDKLAEDWARKHGTEAAANLVLVWLEEKLAQHEMDLASFSLPAPVVSQPVIAKELAVIQAELNYDRQEQRRDAMEKLQNFNEEQRVFFDAVMKTINNEDGGLFFLDAPGGTGKTYLLNGILSAVRSDGYIATATALSAVASKLLTGGSTLHSKLKVPIKIQEDSLCNFTKNSAVGKMMTMAKVLIIDEVSMGDRRIYEAIDRSLRQVRGVDKPMGGLCTVFSGDWRQCLPVIPRGSEAQIVDACLKFSTLWPSIKVFNLTENMRVKMSGSEELADFSSWLLSVGDGTCGDGSVEIPTEMFTDEDRLQSLTDFVYPDLEKNAANGQWLSERAVLCPTNAEAEEINDSMIEQFPGEVIEFKSIDTTENNCTDYTPEFLNSCSLPGVAQHKLKVKRGAPVVLLRNLDPNNGHCNGVKYVVRNIRPHVLELTAISGSNVGFSLFLPRIVMLSESPSLPFTLRRKQFPIRLCFGMTANKAQGQTLARLGIYMGSDFFSHGQVYVALSRCGDRKNIKILKRMQPGATERPTKLKNIVFKSVLTTR